MGPKAMLVFLDPLLIRQNNPHIGKPRLLTLLLSHKVTKFSISQHMQALIERNLFLFYFLFVFKVADPDDEIASCADRCDEPYFPGKPCYCNSACQQYENCLLRLLQRMPA